jgi:hypothetical protein
VLVADSHLDVLHDRHCGDDSAVASMAQFGKLYDRQVGAALGAAAAAKRPRDGAGLQEAAKRPRGEPAAAAAQA